MAPMPILEGVLEEPLQAASSKDLGRPLGSGDATGGISPKTSHLLKPELKDLLQRRRALGAAAVWDSTAFKDEANKNASEDVVLAGQVVQATPAYRSGWSQTPKFHDWGDKFKFVPRPREPRERPVKTEAAVSSKPKEDGRPRRRLQADILGKFSGSAVPDAPGKVLGDKKNRCAEDSLPAKADFIHGFADGRECPEHQAAYAASSFGESSDGTLPLGGRRDATSGVASFSQSHSVEAAAKDAADIMELLVKRKSEKAARSKQSSVAAAEGKASRKPAGGALPSSSSSSRLKLASTAKSSEATATQRAREKQEQRHKQQKKKLDQMLEFATNETAHLNKLIDEARADGEQQEERIHRLLEQKATAERILAESRRQRDDLEVQVRAVAEQRDAAREEGHALAADRDTLESFLRQTQQENARLKDVVSEAARKKCELKDVVEQKACLESELCQAQAACRDLQEKVDKVAYLEMVKEQGLEAIALLEQELLEGMGSREELLAQKEELDTVLTEVREHNESLQAEIQQREKVEARMFLLQQESRELTERVENSAKEKQQIEAKLAQVAEQNRQLQGKLQEALAKTAQLQEANGDFLDGMESCASLDELAMESRELKKELGQVEEANAAIRRQADSLEMDKLALQKELEEEEWWCSSPREENVLPGGFPGMDATLVNIAVTSPWTESIGKDAMQQWLEGSDPSMVRPEIEPGAVAGAMQPVGATAVLSLCESSESDLEPLRRGERTPAPLVHAKPPVAEAALMPILAPATRSSALEPTASAGSIQGRDAAAAPALCRPSAVVPKGPELTFQNVSALPSNLNEPVNFGEDVAFKAANEAAHTCSNPVVVEKLALEKELNQEQWWYVPPRRDVSPGGSSRIVDFPKIGAPSAWPGSVEEFGTHRSKVDLRGARLEGGHSDDGKEPGAGALLLPEATAAASLGVPQEYGVTPGSHPSRMPDESRMPIAMDDAAASSLNAAAMRNIGGDDSFKDRGDRAWPSSAAANVRCKRNEDLATRLDDVLKQNEELQVMIEKELGERDLLSAQPSPDAGMGETPSELDSLLDGWLRALEGEEELQPAPAQDVAQAEDIYADDDEEDMQAYLDKVGRTFYTENAFVIWDPSGGTPMRAPRRCRRARGAVEPNHKGRSTTSDLHAVDEEEEEASEEEDAALDAVKIGAASGLGAALFG